MANRTVQDYAKCTLCGMELLSPAGNFLPPGRCLNCYTPADVDAGPIVIHFPAMAHYVPDRSAKSQGMSSEPGADPPVTDAPPSEQTSWSKPQALPILQGRRFGIP